MSKLFLIFLLLNCLFNLQTGFNLVQEEDIEIKIGTPVEFGKDKNFFKFSYYGTNESKILFYFEGKVVDLYLRDPENEIHFIEGKTKIYEGNLTYNGTYYLELICKSILCEFGGKFYSTILGNTETIDLNENIYSHEFSFYTNGYYYDMKKFKVNNLNEEKIVYFSVIENFRRSTDYYYPFYPGESPPYTPDPYDYREHGFSNLTIFEVFNVKTQTSERNVRFYKFEPNQEYIIYIHCLKYYNNEYGEYYYPKYIFFQVKNSQIKTITGEEGIIFHEGPMFGLVNSNIQKDFYILSDEVYPLEEIGFHLYYAKTNETIENNLEILTSLEFKKYDVLDDTSIHIRKGRVENLVILFLPSSTEYNSKIFVVDQIEYECKTHSLPAHTSELIYCTESMGKISSQFHDYVLTYRSEYKNMKILFSDENENTDYIIQNYLGIPIYIEKTDKECNITITEYRPQFVRFGAENTYIFKTFYNFGQKYFFEDSGINLYNYAKLTQLNIRINTGYSEFFEFYNAYLNQLDIKVNVFIRQLFGISELYECDANYYDIHDLQFLTTPISNAKCKNKKSIFNRLYFLDGTKIISGYIAPDSYFDVYAEIKDDTKKEIDISLLMENELETRNAAKFLKKEVEYKINFELNHLIKLEPGFNAEIKITGGSSTITINSQNPTEKVTGREYTIKSNNDAMLYFIGKLPDGFDQKEINLIESKGKIIKISNIYENDGNFRIDLGFPSYCPSDLPLDLRIRENGVMYLDNIYEKLMPNLLPDEKLYIYSTTEQIKKLKIEYIGKNLNSRNNGFNIFYIPNNDEENTLIINTHEIRYIKIDINFCKIDTILKISFLGDSEENNLTITNNDLYERKLKLFRNDNKMVFKTNQPVVFTYSFYDSIDEENGYPYNIDYWNNRKIMNNLTIDEITRKNKNDNIIKIKFKPNYKQSTTRYIILVAQKNKENTLDNFKDPCYITDLLNHRIQLLKIESIYDVGDNGSVNAEVDITDILSNKDNKYIMNIISQELRFDKKINFYEPKEFILTNDNNEDDNDDGGGLKGASLALAIILPIVGVIIIAAVVIFVLRRKNVSSLDIEKGEKMKELTG